MGCKELTTETDRLVINVRKRHPCDETGCDHYVVFTDKDIGQSIQVEEAEIDIAYEMLNMMRKQ